MIRLNLISMEWTLMSVDPDLAMGSWEDSMGQYILQCA